MADEPVYGANESSWKRIQGSVQRSERGYRNADPPRGTPRNVMPGVIPVKLPATSIAAGTPASPTSGTANLYYPTTAGSPPLTADTATVTIYNIVPAATPTGSKTGYVTWQYGFYYLVDWVC